MKKITLAVIDSFSGDEGLKTINILFLLLFPYIQKLYFDRDSGYFQFSSKYKDNFIKVKKILSDEEFYGLNPKETIIVTNYGFVSGLTNHIDNFKILDFEIAGEYSNSDPDEALQYLNNNNKIVSSEILSIYWNSVKQFEKKRVISFLEHPNIIRSSFASLFLIPSIIKHQISFIDELKVNKNYNYDIFCYFRKNYKGWRGDIIEEIQNQNLKLKIKSDLLSSKNNTFLFEGNSNDDLKKYFNTLNWSDIHTNYFYDVFDSKMVLNFESEIEGLFTFFTEKTLKNLHYGIPFYNVCSLTTTLELQKLGFYSFEMDYIHTFLDEDGNYITDDGVMKQIIIQNCIHFIQNFKENEESIQLKRELFKKNQINLEKLIFEQTPFREELLDKILK